MAIPVFTLTVTYDGSKYRVTSAIPADGGHDMGVAPARAKVAEIAEDDMRDANLAGWIADAVRAHVGWLERQLTGAWEATIPLF